MLKRPRQLRNLLFEQQDIEVEEQDGLYEDQIHENLQVPPEPTENDDQPDDNFPDHPEIDTADLEMLQGPGSIKMGLMDMSMRLQGVLI